MIVRGGGCKAAEKETGSNARRRKVRWAVEKEAGSNARSGTVCKAAEKETGSNVPAVGCLQDSRERNFP